jgi:hypothetical protein
VSYSDRSEKESLITAKENKSENSCKANLIALVVSKQEIIQDAIFIHADPGHAKIDKKGSFNNKTVTSDSDTAIAKFLGPTSNL